MRLSPSQIESIRAAATATFGKKVRMLTLLERDLGERKIDLIIEQPSDPRPIV